MDVPKMKTVFLGSGSECVYDYKCDIILLYNCRCNALYAKRFIRSLCSFILLKRSCTGNLRSFPHELIHGDLYLPGESLAAKLMTSVSLFGN